MRKRNEELIGRSKYRFLIRLLIRLSELYSDFVEFLGFEIQLGGQEYVLYQQVYCDNNFHFCLSGDRSYRMSIQLLIKLIAQLLFLNIRIIESLSTCKVVINMSDTVDLLQTKSDLDDYDYFLCDLALG